MTIPAFDQFVEYITDGPTIHAVALAQQALDSLLALEAVQGGYEHAVALGRTEVLDATALAAVQTAAGEVYHADVVEHEVVSTDPLVIVEALISVRSRPWWHVGLSCVAADAARTIGVYFNPADANLYRCIQPHIAQADWRPDSPGLEALWIRYYAPEEGPREWVQPYGGSGTYVYGAVVTHNGFTWRNILEGTLNVWEPGVFWGWEQVT